MTTEPDWDRPSGSTDPNPTPRERRSIDGLLRAAANLAPIVVPGPIGEELRMTFWTYYNTDGARRFLKLAEAIVASRPSREG